MTLRQRLLIVVAPAAVACATAVGVIEVATRIHDPATKWAAIGAVFTGGGALVAVVGLPLAIWQLVIVQKEQERIAAQLGATVDVKLGFLSSGPDPLSSRLEVVRPSGHDRNMAVPVTVRAKNEGARTAHNPHLVVTCPTGVSVFAVQGGAAQDDSLGRATIHSEQYAALNPLESIQVTFTIQFSSANTDRIKLICGFSSEDAFPLQQDLTIRVTRNGQ